MPYAHNVSTIWLSTCGVPCQLGHRLLEGQLDALAAPRTTIRCLVNYLRRHDDICWGLD